jgi:hypothetical protein
MSPRTALLAATACAGLLVIEPPAATASDKPSPSVLRAALADPFTKDFVEADPGTPNVLEGPFDVQGYANYFQMDPKTRDQLIESLNKEGFLAGYARTWYKPGSQIWMGEGILAFQTGQGATSAMMASKLRYAASPTFKSYVDSSGIPQSIGVTVHDADGFNWTVFLFAKGNDVISILAGSDSDYMGDTALTQAKIEYDLAPASTAGSNPTAGTPGNALAKGVAIGTAVVALLVPLLATLSGVAGLVILIWSIRRRRPDPAPGMPAHVEADKQ